MDTGSSSASIENEELDLPKFVAFKSLSSKKYLRPDGTDNNIKFMDVDIISWGVKHEIQKAKCGGGLVHIRCCDANKYWNWGPSDHKNTWIVAEADEPKEDKSARACTLVKPSQCTKDGVSVINFQLMKEEKWCSIGETDNGCLEAGSGDFIMIDWASMPLPPIANEKMDLPKFVVFQSLSNKNFVRPSGVHNYMKFEAEDVVMWGVKHEVLKANYADGLVHIRCCDSGKYWSWGQTKDSRKFITTQADQSGEDTRRRACTLIKPFHDTKNGVKVVNLEVMYEGNWCTVGVNDGGHLEGGNECFIISDWESFEANHQQKQPSGAKNTETRGSGASIGNEELDWPKFVAINSVMNKKYLNLDGSMYIRFNTVDVQSSSIKHEVQKAKCDDKLIHLKCCETGKYWSWGGNNAKWVVALAAQPEEDRSSGSCTLIKPTHCIKDGITVVNFQIMYKGEWFSIGGEGDGYLLTGGEDFMVSNWETLQMGLKSGPRGGWVAKSITTKLSQKNYSKWKQQMLMFLLSEELSGYVDGTIKPVWDEGDSAYPEWKKFNDLVRGWILATLTESILRQVMKFVTAREVWMELKKLFSTTFQLFLTEVIDLNDQKRGQIVSDYMELHKAILMADWETAAEFLNKNEEAVGTPITSCSETALIVAVRSQKRNEIVVNLVHKMMQKDKSLLALEDITGATALHAAVNGGNIEAAGLLIEKSPELANIRDKHGTLAVHVAAGLGDRKMVDLLKDKTTGLYDQKESGLKFLHFLASSGLHDIALEFLQKDKSLAGLEPSPLVVIAEQHTSFPSGTRLNFLQRSIYSGISPKLEGIAKERDVARDRRQGRDIENNLQERDTTNHPQERKRLNAQCWNIAKTLAKESQKKLNSLFWNIAEIFESKVLFRFNCQLIKSVRETKITHYRALNLVNCLCKEVVENIPENAAEIFTEPLRNATRMGIHEIVEEILHSYPNAMHLRSEANQSLFHLAVMYRHENVFNLIYRMEEDWRALLSMPDVSKNNALHLAGNLGPEQQLGLRASAAGAALQMQRELQWFKEVGNLILPQAKERKNKDEKTPRELFTETHKDLVEQGEKWMKDTANSCSIVAALITTIVFAAAITVPGGSGGDQGLPVRLGYGVFTLFMVSDALAMFSSSSSLLMFLSILTSRYGEQDFLYSLPRRMIIGLATLFLSIVFMMVAFAATLEIVYGETKAWIIICVAILSGVPITLFALLQLPLLYDMIKSTYFPSIGKRSNHILH